MANFNLTQLNNAGKPATLKPFVGQTLPNLAGGAFALSQMNSGKTPIGVQAKAPEQNVKPVTNTLTPQVKKTTTDFYKQNGSYYLTNGQKISNLTELAKYAKTGKEVAAPSQSVPKSTSGAIPQGQVAIPGGQIDKYNVTGQFGQTGTPGSGLYGTLKPTSTSAPTASSPAAEAPKPTDISSGGILTNLVNTANQGSQTAQQAQTGLLGTAQENPATSGQAYTDYQTAIDELNALKSSMAGAEANIEGSPIPLEFQQGRSQILNKQYASQLDAAQQKVNQAQAAIQQQIAGTQAQQAGYNQAGTLGQTGQGLTQSGLTSAAGFAQPVQVPYSNQFLNPQTGLPIDGGAAGGTLQNAVSNIAEKVFSGNMGYDAGVQALSGYGQAGVNLLQQMLGPSFNIQQSNARAQAQSASTIQTGTIGGQLTKAADSANQALVKLEQDFANLNSLQTGGIPLTNSIANWLANKFGQGALSSYQTTLQDARAQLGGVLTATGAVSPTGAENMARTYLPDDMTPTMLREKLAAARALIEQKVSAFTNQSQSTSGGNNVGSGTTSSGIGYTIIEE